MAADPAAGGAELVLYEPVMLKDDSFAIIERKPAKESFFLRSGPTVLTFLEKTHWATRGSMLGTFSANRRGAFLVESLCALRHAPSAECWQREGRIEHRPDNLPQLTELGRRVASGQANEDDQKSFSPQTKLYSMVWRCPVKYGSIAVEVTARVKDAAKNAIVVHITGQYNEGVRRAGAFSRLLVVSCVLLKNKTMHLCVYTS